MMLWTKEKRLNWSFMEIDIYKGSQCYHIEVKFKKMKRMVLRYREGKYLLSAPLYAQENNLKAWLDELQQEDFERLRACVKVKETDQFVYIFGQKYFLKHYPLGDGLKIKDNVLRIYAHNRVKALEVYLNNTLYQYIEKRIAFYYQQGICPVLPTFELTKMKASYGKCACQLHHIRFARSLIHEPPKVIDSVIVHELAHLKYPNHSQNFYAWVRLFDPTYDLSTNYLKQGGAGDDSIDK